MSVETNKLKDSSAYGNIQSYQLFPNYGSLPGKKKWKKNRGRDIQSIAGRLVNKDLYHLVRTLR